MCKLANFFTLLLKKVNAVTKYIHNIKLHYLFEAFFVGVYASAISILVPIKTPFFFFVVGFLKHFLAYLTGVHAYYCKYGHACKFVKKTSLPNPILESIAEGIVFFILGLFMKNVGLFMKYRIFSFFLIGFFLHIISEKLGIHHWFCKRCT
jgi:hypothetical protein